MMNTKGKFATVLTVLTLLGCKGPLATSAASPGDGAYDSSAPGGATRIEYITDPTLNNMRVMPIQIPASWRFRGVLVAKSPCTFDLSEVFRATSPDGHSFVEVMPALGWKWGNVPGLTPAAATACLPIERPMSAQEFLKYFSTTLQVEYLGDEPIPGQQAGGVKTPLGLRTAAMANVRFKNGPLNMRGMLGVILTCRQVAPMGMQPGPNRAQGYPRPAGDSSASAAGRCNAVVHYLTAPENQIAQVKQIWSAAGMGQHKELDDWVSVWSQRYNDQNQAETRQLINESNAEFAARQQMYKDQAAVQQQAHNQFLQTLRDGTDKSMANAARIANSNHTMASDMVDYSLDRRTLLDTNTGVIYKTGNQVTPGTSQVPVHGDGTPF